MKVLLSSASFALEYGGPAYSVRALAVQLSKTGLNVAIWAPDGSACQVSLLTGSVGGPRVLRGSLSEALSVFGAPDLFHDSGLWRRHNRLIASAARRMNRPVVVSVRGMLEPAALNHRAWRKVIAWSLYQRRNLDRAAALHVTGELEAGNVKALGLRSRIVCIPNGVSIPQQYPVRDRLPQKRVTFLGRLHPIKGLPLLLEAWGRIRPPDWVLEIVGPDEDGHRRSLEERVRILGLGRFVIFTGPVGGSEKTALLSRTSALVLPSHSESFGLVVCEALGEGVPVIATYGSPWAALEVEDCGWYVPASVDGLELGLRNLFATPQEELVAMGQRGHSFVAREFSWTHVATKIVDLYRGILSENRSY